jgi:predicted alpha/beta hydrolase family esterase
MKKQIVVIGGGDTFETYEQYLDWLKDFKIDIERYKTGVDDWKPWLRLVLGEEYEVILPQMPNKFNARYDEWKLWFEKFIPHLYDGVILIGHSLGGSFLAKYLSENVFPKKIKAVMLVSAVYDKDSDGYSLLSFAPSATLDFQTENIFLYHSKDDPTVPFSALEQFHKALPNAKVLVFEDRKHLNQPEFPELVEDIKNL